jgi:simple sugar transport system substrate-binding protein
MNKKTAWQIIVLLLIAILVLAACAPAATPEPTQAPVQQQPTEAAAAPATAVTATDAPATAAPATMVPESSAAPFTFGLLMVGPYNDHGWSEAHYQAGLYVEQNLPNTKMLYIDKVNPADRPGTTPDQLASDLVSKGAQLIIFNSDDMKDSALEFAKNNPDVPVLHISGDSAWKEGQNYQNLPNLSNYMPQMEFGEMIGGCSAALSTQTGKLGFVGPLINDETRRYANAFYLGARYCWTNYRQKDPAELQMNVTWIGYWFNIPGVTSDPSQVSDVFLSSGYDVLASGLDTTEALVETGKAAANGQQAWSVAYDYEDACSVAPDACLGVRYFNWRPAYMEAIQAVQAGTFKSYWEFAAPDWTNINNIDTSPVGFKKGNGLGAENSATLDKFIAELAGGLNLYTGPLNWQDGTPFLKEGEKATEVQIWYEPQLLEGIEGQSVSQ